MRNLKLSLLLILAINSFSQIKNNPNIIEHKDFNKGIILYKKTEFSFENNQKKIQGIFIAKYRKDGKIASREWLDDKQQITRSLINHYNSKNQLKKVTFSNKEHQGYSSGTNYSYNKKELLVFESKYSESLIEEKSYLYNKQNKITEKRISKKNENYPEDNVDRIVIYKYNSENRLIEKLKINVDDVSVEKPKETKWYNSERKLIISYNKQGDTLSKKWADDSNKTTKIISFLKGLKIKEHGYFYGTTGKEDSFHINYKYNTHNKLVEKTEYSYDGGNEYETYKTQYTYDNKGRVVLKKLLASTEGSLIKYKYNYNDDKKSIKVIYISKDRFGTEKNEKIYKYNGKGDVMSILIKYYNEEEKVASKSLLEFEIIYSK